MPKLGDGVEKRVLVKVYVKPEAHGILAAHAKKRDMPLSVWAAEALRRQYEVEQR